MEISQRGDFVPLQREATLGRNWLAVKRTIFRVGLARLSRAGELTAVSMPDVRDEAVRDLVRPRAAGESELVLVDTLAD